MKTLAYFSHPLATVAPRDLLLAEQLELQPRDVVLEIGTGSGSSLFRLAQSVAGYHGVDIAAGPVDRLRRAVIRSRKRLGDVQLLVRDFCDPDVATQLPCRYDLIFTCDTLEHVEQPQAFLANVFRALKPGGRAFITYPNEHPERAHGITFFERRSELVGMLCQAGFSPDQIRVDALQMATLPSHVLWLGWELPRRLAKRTVRLDARAKPANGQPQTFDETDFFAFADRVERWAPMINAYCWSVLKAMACVGPVYRVSPTDEIIWDTRILIRAVRTAE